jgi:hypothetical protein
MNLNLNELKPFTLILIYQCFEFIPPLLISLAYQVSRLSQKGKDLFYYLSPHPTLSRKGRGIIVIVDNL